MLVYYIISHNIMLPVLCRKRRGCRRRPPVAPRLRGRAHVGKSNASLRDHELSVWPVRW